MSPVARGRQTAEVKNTGPEGAVTAWGRAACVDLVVFAVALGLRLWHLYSSAGVDPYFHLPSVDPAFYHERAVQLAAGRGAVDEVYFIAPMYSWFLAALYALVGPSMTAAKTVQAVLGALTAVLLKRTGQRLFGPAAGAGAGLVWAVYAPAIFYETILHSCALQAFLNVAAVWGLVGLKGAKRPSARLFMSGFLLGLSALVRPHVLLFAPLGALFAWFAAGRVEPRRRLCGAAVFVGGAALAVAPATVHNLAAGDFVAVSSSGGINFYIGNGPGANGQFVVPQPFAPWQADRPDEQERVFAELAEKEIGRALLPSEVSGFWFERAVEHIIDEPGSFVRLLGKKALLAVGDLEPSNSRSFAEARGFSKVLQLPLPTLGWVLPFAAAALLGAGRPVWRTMPVWGMLLVYGLSLLSFFVLAHYRLSVVPFAALYAGRGAALFVEWGRRRDFGKAAAGLLSVLLVFGLARAPVADPDAALFMNHYNLGNRYRKLGHFEPAVRAYEESLALRPGFVSAHNNLALSLERIPGREQEALEQWRIVERIARTGKDELYIERARRHIELLRRILRQNTDRKFPNGR